MYVLLPLLASLVLLAMTGTVWVEAHLLPPVRPPPPSQAVPVAASDMPAAESAEWPQRIHSVPGHARESAVDAAVPPELITSALIVPDPLVSGSPGQLAV